MSTGELCAKPSQRKTLSGLRPLCSWCKSIRDVNGNWNKAESYSVSPSETEFTHSICPECMDKLYPENSSDRAGTLSQIMLVTTKKGI